MSLAHRIIPTLLVRGDSLVKGVRFDAWRSVGHPLQAARIHAARGVDELLYLDIAATPEGRGPDFKQIERLTRDVLCPITVGGGVRSVQDVRDLLNAGADKVAIGTCTTDRFKALREASARFGKQAIVAILSYQESKIHDGLVPAARLRVSQGAGELVLQPMEREGTMNGYDLSTLRTVSATVDVPVIASCGCGSYEHMREAIEAGADAVAAGAFFQFTDATPRGAAEYLMQHGIEARIAA